MVVFFLFSHRVGYFVRSFQKVGAHHTVQNTQKAIL